MTVEVRCVGAIPTGLTIAMMRHSWREGKQNCFVASAGTKQLYPASDLAQKIAVGLLLACVLFLLGSGPASVLYYLDSLPLTLFATQPPTDPIPGMFKRCQRTTG